MTDKTCSKCGSDKVEMTWRAGKWIYRCLELECEHIEENPVSVDERRDWGV